ncbi:MAG TPA: methyltransferase domain-containing protein [Chloroflexota bacterium]|nr:methyltransferase domain-containing protein [Chloroflexota bacterium]
MTQTVGEGATGERRGGSHDWHDAEYVREWVAENEARIEARRSQFELIADFIPHRSDAAISILDVGAGWGPVTRHLLRRFPNARATLFDYSDEMFGQARAVLGAAGMTDRVWLVKGDLSQHGALDAALREAGGTFDAIVSSSCIHNVRPTERIPLLYREVRGATAAGGCFLNLDMVGTSGETVQAAWRHGRVEQERRRRQAETGTLQSWDEAEGALEAERRARAERHGGHGRPGPAQPTFATSGGQSRALSDHLGWLRDAGFDGVECFWRQENRALIGGFRAR